MNRSSSAASLHKLRVPAKSLFKDSDKTTQDSAKSIVKLDIPTKKVQQVTKALTNDEKRARLQALQEKTQKKAVQAQKENSQPFYKSSDCMFRHQKMDHVKTNRGRLLNWFVEICYLFNQSWRTLWTTIALLDKLIVEKGKICPENLFLNGLGCLFIASKIHEVYSLPMRIMVEKIGLGKCTKEEILQCESEIFTWVCITRNDTSLYFPTFEDRIYEQFPNLPHSIAKILMTDIFYCVQSPSMLMEERKGEKELTESDLIFLVAERFAQGKRFEPSVMIEDYFKVNWNCTSMSEFGLKLKL